MAYNAAQHAAYTEQLQEWARAFWNLKEEAIRLRQFRQFQINNGAAGALSNADADFVETPNYTTAELESLSTLQDQFKRWTEGDATVPDTNKTSMYTPFLQV